MKCTRGRAEEMGSFVREWDEFETKKLESLILEVRREVVEECRKALHDLPIWTPGTIDRALDDIEGGEK